MISHRGRQRIHAALVFERFDYISMRYYSVSVNKTPYPENPLMAGVEALTDRRLVAEPLTGSLP